MRKGKIARLFLEKNHLFGLSKDLRKQRQLGREERGKRRGRWLLEFLGGGESSGGGGESPSPKKLPLASASRCWLGMVVGASVQSVGGETLLQNGGGDPRQGIPRKSKQIEALKRPPKIRIRLCPILKKQVLYLQSFSCSAQTHLASKKEIGTSSKEIPRKKQRVS